jgi:hypothetical protein
VARIDDRLLIGYKRWWELNMADTSREYETNELVVSSLGPQYKDTATPPIQLGHCTLAGIVPIERKRDK